jgi:hypothetical protein
MSLIFKYGTCSLVRRVTMWHSFKNWHASKRLSNSFSHWQCPSDGDFSFPRFVGLLILSLWFYVFTSTADVSNAKFLINYQHSVLLLRLWSAIWSIITYIHNIMPVSLWGRQRSLPSICYDPNKHFRFFYCHQIPHTRSPVSSTPDLTLL